jgi:hypothetical protein
MTVSQRLAVRERVRKGDVRTLSGEQLAGRTGALI